MNAPHAPPAPIPINPEKAAAHALKAAEEPPPPKPAPPGPRPLGPHEVRGTNFTHAGKMWRVIVQKPVVSIREYDQHGDLMVYAIGTSKDLRTMRGMQVCYPPPKGLIVAAFAALRRVLGRRNPRKADLSVEPAAPAVLITVSDAKAAELDEKIHAAALAGSGMVSDG